MRRRRRRNDDEPREPINKPPDEFCEWWSPYTTAEPSGASVGGHPDAERVWVRKDPGRWTRRVYGITANKAWTCAPYRREFNMWIEAGRPETERFVSICATLKEQQEFYRGIKSTLAQIGKPMPKEDKQPLPKALPEAGVVDAEFTKLDDDDSIPF